VRKSCLEDMLEAMTAHIARLSGHVNEFARTDDMLTDLFVMQNKFIIGHTNDAGLKEYTRLLDLLQEKHEQKTKDIKPPK